MKYLLTKLFLITLLLVSCKKNLSQEEKILSVIQDSLQVKDDYEKIYILQSAGCYVCNVKFAEYLAQKQFSNKELVIVSTHNADGFISKTPLENSSNVIVDRKSLFFRNAILNHSAVIYFENQKIDTLVNLSDARVFYSNMNYIQNR